MSGEVRFSIVEPYWERQAGLRAQLENYLQRGFHAREDLEIIVVDDGSPTQPARPVIEEYRDRFVADLRLVEMPIKHEGKDNCVVFNRGVAEARGEWMFLTQVDIHHTEDSVDLLAWAAENNDMKRTVLYPCSLCTGRGFRTTQHTPGCAPDFIMIRKELYDEVGGFCEEFRDGYAVSDLDFRLSLEHHKVQVACVVDLLVIHHYEKSESWKHDDDGWGRNNEILLRRAREWGVTEYSVTPYLLRPGIQIRRGLAVTQQCTTK